ncbi:hypothetical protein, partial [Chamaesiphon sp. OTE_75_metabat_556]|uniref:hypothetical protein n=1 Tax=Chamaesiphon sp. OTE_75_metabat_556 TaxID=2964692 RepID=UPI00286C6556
MKYALSKGILQFSIVSATTAIALTTATTAWSANLSFVSSRDALGANDFVDWSNPITQLTSAPANFTTLSAGGITVTGSQAGAFGEVRRQNSTPYTDEASLPGSATANTTFWNGNFAPNDAVYWNKGSANGISGLTLSFATPVSAVGTQLNSLFYHGSGQVGVSPFRGTITAFFGNGGSQTATVNDALTSALADNSAEFFGFTSDSADITSVVFNTTDLINNDGYNFALNRVSLRTTSGVQAVPEPFSILGTIFGGAAA